MNSNSRLRNLVSGASFLWIMQSTLAGAEITLQSTGETLSGDMTISQDLGLTEGSNLLHTFFNFQHRCWRVGNLYG